MGLLGVARASQLHLAQPLLTLVWSVLLLGEHVGQAVPTHHRHRARLHRRHAAGQKVTPLGKSLRHPGRRPGHTQEELFASVDALLEEEPQLPPPAERARRTFGTPLFRNQHVRFTLASLRAETEEVRAAVLQGVRLLALGGLLGGVRCGVQVSCAEVLQLAGADGHVTGCPAERALRDSGGLSLAGGTDELMLMQIAWG